MKNAEKLLKTIDEKIKNWNERSSFTIKGIRNLSVSDLDTLVLYANEYLTTDERNFGDLMSPLGNIKSVLDKYGVIAK